jgi:hypothetical protein
VNSLQSQLPVETHGRVSQEKIMAARNFIGHPNSEGIVIINFMKKPAHPFLKQNFILSLRHIFKKIIVELCQ